MQQRIDHAPFIEDWLRQNACCHSREQLRDLFSRAFDALWRRSLVTLGEVTLSAIFDRILYRSKRAYPWLDAVILFEHGFSLEKLDMLDDGSELLTGLKHILLELLTVLGSLTADALTKQLHAELALVTCVSSDAGLNSNNSQNHTPKSRKGT